MSDPVALALIAMVGGIMANVVLAWRGIVVTKEAKREAADAKEAARIAAEKAELARVIVAERVK